MHTNPPGYNDGNVCACVCVYVRACVLSNRSERKLPTSRVAITVGLASLGCRRCAECFSGVRADK